MAATIPPIPRFLGFAGLLPQAAALYLVFSRSPDWMFTAQSIAFAYAALIFSFIGGMWWGIAATTKPPPRGLWYLAVTPSLIALAAAWPWATGTTWPGPSLIVLSIGILSSLVIDWRLSMSGAVPNWWMPLRIQLSVGLGVMTAAIGWLSLPH